jgi:hypothetical protein
MHDHSIKRARWWTYTPKWSLTPFTSQLQTVLTAYYEKIKGVVSASGCTKSWVVKRKFEDRTCARRRPRRPRRRQRLHPRYPAGRERCSRTRRGGASSGPQPWGQGRQGGKAGKAGGGGRKAGKAQGWCRLNSCAWTWIGVTPGSSQSQPAGQPAWQIKKLDPKGYIKVLTGSAMSVHFVKCM